jgi:hypothetical protein
VQANACNDQLFSRAGSYIALVVVRHPNFYRLSATSFDFATRKATEGGINMLEHGGEWKPPSPATFPE